MIFEFSNGGRKYVNVSNEITIEELLRKIVKENNLKIEDFFFIFNAKKLKIDDKTKLKDFPIRHGSVIKAYEINKNPC